MDNRTRPIYMLPARASFQMERHLQIGREGLGKHSACTWTPEESRAAILVLDKRDLRAKMVTGDKEGH